MKRGNNDKRGRVILLLFFPSCDCLLQTDVESERLGETVSSSIKPRRGSVEKGGGKGGIEA